MYNLRLEKQPRKFILDFSKKLQVKIIKQLENLKNNPRPIGCTKLIKEEGYRIRFGSYRVLYTIDDKEKEIIVYKIKHRKESYDK